MSKGDATGMRFAQRGRLGRRFAALVRVGLGRVAPRIVRVTVPRVRSPIVGTGGLVAAAAAMPVAWRKASLPAMTSRHRRDAGWAAVRKGIALLRAWGGVKPAVRRGARETAKVVGRAFVRSGGRQVARRHVDAVETPTAGHGLKGPLHAGVARRAMRFMEGSVLGRFPIAPVGTSGGGRDVRRSLVSDAGASAVRRQDLPDGGVMPAAVRGRVATEAPGTVGQPEAEGATAERAGPADMARWLGALFSDEARRPPSGVTGFDGRLSPIFPGRKPGF